MQVQKHKSHVGSRHMYTIYVFFCLSTPLPFTVSSSVLGYIQSLGFPAYSVFIIFQLKVSILFKVADAPVRSLHGVTGRDSILCNVRGVGAVQFTTGTLYVHQYRLSLCQGCLRKAYLIICLVLFEYISQSCYQIGYFLL